MIDYLIVGHVTKDVTPDGFSLGGNSHLCRLDGDSASALRVGIVTAARMTSIWRDSARRRDPRSSPPPSTTTFENTYYTDGRRTQRFLRSRAKTSGSSTFPPSGGRRRSSTWLHSPRSSARA